MRAHKTLSLSALVASTLLATSIVPTLASTAEAAPSALVEHNREAEPAATAKDTRADAKRYAEAEKRAPQAAEFNGGAAVVLIGSTAAMVLLLLIVLLVV